MNECSMKKMKVTSIIDAVLVLTHRVIDFYPVFKILSAHLAITTYDHLRYVSNQIL